MEIETYRSVVAPAHCDVLGHMNVSRYFAAVGDGMFSFQSAMGLTAEDIKSGRKISFAVVHAESDFRSEVLAGEVIFLTSAVRRSPTGSQNSATGFIAPATAGSPSRRTSPA